MLLFFSFFVVLLLIAGCDNGSSGGSSSDGAGSDSALEVAQTGSDGLDGENMAQADNENGYTEEDVPGVIVAMGDSLTAGYGVAQDEAYPALLEKALHEAGYNYTVVNSGVSGETSSGALERLDWVLQLSPDILILETGANDGLRGVDPELAQKNMDAILRRLDEDGITVVFAGMQMVWNLGPAYVRRFNAIYPELAEKFDVVFYPFFLDGVAMQAGLNQADGVHPNAAGYRIIAERIYPSVVEAIKKSGASR